MAVELQPQATTTVLPEYAATNISFTRTVQNISGALVPVYSANISYERKDYIVDANGNKIGLITLNTPPEEEAGIKDPTRGLIFLGPDETMALFAKVPDSGKAIGEIIADEADSLIHAHLISRGIINA